MVRVLCFILLAVVVHPLDILHCVDRHCIMTYRLTHYRCTARKQYPSFIIDIYKMYLFHYCHFCVEDNKNKLTAF